MESMKNIEFYIEGNEQKTLVLKPIWQENSGRISCTLSGKGSLHKQVAEGILCLQESVIQDLVERYYGEDTETWEKDYYEWLNGK